VPTTVYYIVSGSAKIVHSWQFPIFLYTKINKIKSRRLRRKREKIYRKKCVYNPADLSVAIAEIRGITAKKSGSEKVQSLDILQDPTSILDCDKPSFHFCPKAGKVLKYKGDKNAHEIDRGIAKVSVTRMLAFSASGMMCPPTLIYIYKRIPLEITKRVPDDWGVGHSPAGWIIAEAFYEYTGNLFTSHLANIMSSSLLNFLLIDTAPI
jgi:hypothetical protein